MEMKEHLSEFIRKVEEDDIEIESSDDDEDQDQEYEPQF